MANKMKPQRLRAFRVENNEITQSNSGLLNNLTNRLNGSKAANRRMPLNNEDIKREEDLISDFSPYGWGVNSFSLCIIQLSIALVTAAGVSFMAVRKIFIYLDICLLLNLKVPTHTTVLNWTKKQGISQFQNREFYRPV